jgi:hypothetical protein
MDRRRLDDFVLDVELVLISVVQAAALTTLAVAAAPLLGEHRIETYAFIGSGLAFVMSFWSVSLIHALSFVRWPADLVHYFFYFVLGFCECLTFMAMDRPRDWFGLMLLSFLVTWVLYVYDYRLMLRHRDAFPADGAGQALRAHVIRRQRFEMLVLVPAGMAFCLLAWILVGRQAAAVRPMALAQVVFAVVFVVSFVRSFAERQRLITASLGETR